MGIQNEFLCSFVGLASLLAVMLTVGSVMVMEFGKAVHPQPTHGSVSHASRPLEGQSFAWGTIPKIQEVTTVVAAVSLIFVYVLTAYNFTKTYTLRDDSMKQLLVTHSAIWITLLVASCSLFLMRVVTDPLFPASSASPGQEATAGADSNRNNFHLLVASSILGFLAAGDLLIIALLCLLDLKGVIRILGSS